MLCGLENIFKNNLSSVANEKITSLPLSRSKEPTRSRFISHLPCAATSINISQCSVAWIGRFSRGSARQLADEVLLLTSSYRKRPNPSRFGRFSFSINPLAISIPMLQFLQTPLCRPWPLALCGCKPAGPVHCPAPQPTRPSAFFD